VPAQKCPYHVTFDLDLDLEHTLDAGLPGVHRVQVWWRFDHLPARSDGQCKFSTLCTLWKNWLQYFAPASGRSNNDGSKVSNWNKKLKLGYYTRVFHIVIPRWPSNNSFNEFCFGIALQWNAGRIKKENKQCRISYFRIRNTIRISNVDVNTRVGYFSVFGIRASESWWKVSVNLNAEDGEDDEESAADENDVSDRSERRQQRLDHEF